MAPDFLALKGAQATTPRNSLAIAMLCAWNNIPPDQMPPEWANHPNDQNRIAWERVAEAARKFIEEERQMPSPLNSEPLHDIAP